MIASNLCRKIYADTIVYAQTQRVYRLHECSFLSFLDTERDKIESLIEYLDTQPDMILVDGATAAVGAVVVESGQLVVEGQPLVDMTHEDVTTQLLTWAAAFPIFHLTYPSSKKGGDLALFMSQCVPKEPGQGAAGKVHPESG